MESESRVIRSMIDELYSLVIEGDQREGEKGVNRSISDEFNSSESQADQMKCESVVT